MKKPLKPLAIIFFTAVLFFIVTMPFRELFRVIEVTEMRPASALPPVFGLLLGFPGALGCAIGNFFADLLTGYGLTVSLSCFLPQLAYGVIPILMWNKFTHYEGLSGFRLHNVKNIIRYIVIIIIDSAAVAISLGIILQALGMSRLFSTVTLMMFLNNFVFCILLGIPIIVFVTMRRLKHSQRCLTLNERFVLIFLLLGITSASLTGFFSYTELSRLINNSIALWNSIYIIIAIDLAVIYFVAILFLRYTEKNISIPIETIAHIAEHYTDAENEKRDSLSVVNECDAFCEIRNEAGALAKSFKTMVVDLDKYIDNLTSVTAERERIGAELNIAAKIQADMLPRVFPAFPDREEFDLFAMMIPAKEVGGDFYDFFLIDDNHLCVVVADVSGKGVPAALFMVIAKTLINNSAREGESPQNIFTKINNRLCEGNQNAMFVTAWLGILEINTGKLTYVNAGHNPPLLKKANEEFKYLKSKRNLVLAFAQDFQYEQFELNLSGGDRLFLYTDGVTEANSPTQELYGETRLVHALNGNSDLPPSLLLPYVKRDVDRFADNAPQFDDITMLALELK